MAAIWTSIAFALIVIAVIDTAAEDVPIEKSFKSEQVVPDVVSVAPKTLLKIKYANLEVTPGGELTPTQVKSEPIVQWQADPKSFYTLCMTDPDAPSRVKPTRREWRHWLVGNIPGSDLAKGESLTQYVGSGPPKDTGLHRYVFLLYKQPGKIDFKEPRVTNRSSRTRASFSIANFAEKYSLGSPIAGNFFQAEYDDYVPTLHKQLSP